MAYEEQLLHHRGPRRGKAVVKPCTAAWAISFGVGRLPSAKDSVVREAIVEGSAGPTEPPT